MVNRTKKFAALRRSFGEKFCKKIEVMYSFAISSASRLASDLIGKIHWEIQSWRTSEYYQRSRKDYRYFRLVYGAQNLKDRHLSVFFFKFYVFWISCELFERFSSKWSGTWSPNSFWAYSLRLVGCEFDLVQISAEKVHRKFWLIMCESKHKRFHEVWW